MSLVVLLLSLALLGVVFDAGGTWDFSGCPCCGVSCPCRPLPGTVTLTVVAVSGCPDPMNACCSLVGKSWTLHFVKLSPEGQLVNAWVPIADPGYFNNCGDQTLPYNDAGGTEANIYGYGKHLDGYDVGLLFSPAFAALKCIPDADPPTLASWFLTCLGDNCHGTIHPLDDSSPDMPLGNICLGTPTTDPLSTCGHLIFSTVGGAASPMGICEVTLVISW